MSTVQRLIASESTDIVRLVTRRSSSVARTSRASGVSAPPSPGGGSNFVPLVPRHFSDFADRQPKSPDSQDRVPHFPRSGAQRGFEHSPVSSTIFVRPTLLANRRSVESEGVKGTPQGGRQLYLSRHLNRRREGGGPPRRRTWIKSQ